MFTGPKFNRGYEAAHKVIFQVAVVVLLRPPRQDLETAASAQEIFEISGIPRVSKGLINLVLIDSDKWDGKAHAKSYIVDTSPKCAEYLLQKNDRSLI